MRALTVLRSALELLWVPVRTFHALGQRIHKVAAEVRVVLRLAAGLLRPYRGQLVVVVLGVALETATGLATPWPLKIVLDHVVGSRVPPAWLRRAADLLPGSGAIALAELAALILVLAAALGALASFVGGYCTERVGQGLAQGLRLKLYHQLQHLSLAYHDTHSTGQLVSTINADVDVIQDFATCKVLDIVVDAAQVVGMLGLMFWLDWNFAVVIACVAPFLALYVSRFKGTVKDATREVRKRQGDMLGVLQQGLESVRLTQAFGREDLEERRLGDAAQATVDASLQARRVKSVLSPVVSVVVALCSAFVLWRGASLVLASTMTVGALIMFLAYLGKFFKPLQDLAKKNGAVAQAAVAAERIRDILEADERIPERPDARDPGRIAGAITFDHVAFGYDAARPVLRDVTVSIRAGEHIGVVGATGAGKSTLVSLVARLYDPTAGRILIDGIDVRDYRLQALRDRIGWVLQDAFLFRGTIRENIAYGRPAASHDEIVEAARLANAHAFIARLPHGYDAVIGERGLTLSGGERQRIGIARAILRDAPILILDEPTASLDADSERLVVEALERVTRGRTVITIAHRLSTLRAADRIVVLSDGRATEQGRHEELIARGGTYARLHLIQGGAYDFANHGLQAAGA